MQATSQIVLHDVSTDLEGCPDALPSFSLAYTHWKRGLKMGAEALSQPWSASISSLSGQHLDEYQQKTSMPR
jgi:hypothetical protein